MTRARLVQIAALAACAVLLVIAFQATPPINRGRAALNMIGTESPMENTPPEYAFAIQAFGAFRSLIANVAFMRAETLKREGRFYDAMQLHTWMCKLQPRFPTVWEYASWNMAWNISVTTYTAEERWNWVYNGVKLVRDEGLRYNPRAVNLYKQLGWIFFNKMGEAIDEYHMAYKRNWAWRMHLVLGPPPDPLGLYRPEEFKPLEGGIGNDPITQAARREAERRNEELRALGRPVPELPPPAASQPVDPAAPREFTPTQLVARAAYDKIDAIDKAPRSLAALYEQNPATRDMVEKLREIGAEIDDRELSEEDYWRPDGGLAVTFFQRYRQLTDGPSLLARIWGRDKQSPDAANIAKLDQIVGVTTNHADGEALVRFLQRKVLVEVYKLDPSHMKLLIQTFGPMDWRVVEAHSLYWTTLAIIKGDETISSFRNDKTNTARMVFFSLNGLMRKNSLTFEPYYPDITLSYYNQAPDLNFIDAMHRAYLTYGAMIDPEPGRGGAGETYRTGHINFLTDAIAALYFGGREAEAAYYYKYIGDTYAVDGFGRPTLAYSEPLRDFVVDSFLEGIEGFEQTRSVVGNLIARSYNELRQGNMASYNRMMSYARDLMRRFEETQKRAAGLRPMPPLPEIQIDVLREMLGAPSPSAIGTIEKARLWKYLPLFLKQPVYDELIDGLRKECELWGFETAAAFPEPAEMAAYRESVGRRGPEADPNRKEGVYTPPRRND